MCACVPSHRGCYNPERAAARGEAPGRRKGEPSAERYFVFTVAFTASAFALSPADRVSSFSVRDTPDGVVFFADTVITIVRSPPAGTDTKYVPLVTSFLITLPPLE